LPSLWMLVDCSHSSKSHTYFSRSISLARSFAQGTAVQPSCNNSNNCDSTIINIFIRVRQPSLSAIRASILLYSTRGAVVRASKNRTIF
jgi:hypothetical protein